MNRTVHNRNPRVRNPATCAISANHKFHQTSRWKNTPFSKATEHPKKTCILSKVLNFIQASVSTTQIMMACCGQKSRCWYQDPSKWYWQGASEKKDFGEKKNIKKNPETFRFRVGFFSLQVQLPDVLASTRLASTLGAINHPRDFRNQQIFGSKKVKKLAATGSFPTSGSAMASQLRSWKSHGCLSATC